MEAATQIPASERLSSFIVDHDRCGGGFDISHPGGVGSGVIRLTCAGCGASAEYGPATIEIEREVEFAPTGGLHSAPATVPQLPPSPVQRLKADEKAKLPVGKAAGARRNRRRVALLLFALAIAALAFAWIRVSQDRHSSSPTTGSETAIEATHTVHGDHYSIVVPSNWKESRVANSDLLGSPDSAAFVQIYGSRNPGMTKSTMISSATSFLRSHTSEGSFGTPQDVDVSGGSAFELVDRGPGGTETALGVLAGDWRYLVLGGAANRASPADRAAVRLALSSFHAN